MQRSGCPHHVKLIQWQLKLLGKCGSLHAADSDIEAGTENILINDYTKSENSRVSSVLRGQPLLFIQKMEVGNFPWFLSTVKSWFVKLISSFFRWEKPPQPNFWDLVAASRVSDASSAVKQMFSNGFLGILLINSSKPTYIVLVAPKGPFTQGNLGNLCFPLWQILYIYWLSIHP